MLELGTINGARALRLADKIGSLEIGKEADIVAIKLQAYPVYNPVHTLVYVGSSTNSVDYVWVGGQLLMDKSQLKTMDVSRLRSDAQLWGEKITGWHKERRVVDIKSIGATLTDIEEKLNNFPQQQINKEELEMYNNSLSSLKQSLFHWTFFANRGELEGDQVTTQQLEGVSTRVTTSAKRIEEALSSSK